MQKAKEEVQRTKDKYEAALQEINSYNPKYIEDMQEVFDKCQQMEAQRLVFFKEVLFTIHKGLNISQDPRYAATERRFRRLGSLGALVMTGAIWPTISSRQWIEPDAYRAEANDGNWHRLPGFRCQLFARSRVLLAGPVACVPYLAHRSRSGALFF